MTEKILSQEEEFTLASISQGALDWCIYFSYQHGFSRGRNTADKNWLANELNPSFDRFSMRWGGGYGKITVYPVYPKLFNSFERDLELFHGFNVDMEFVVFGQKENNFDFDFIVLAASSVESIMTRLLHGISFKNKLTYCETPHLIENILGNTRIERQVAVCNNVGGHWLCDKCIDRFSLAPASVQISTQEQDPRKIERAKMTPSLRYSILLRDNFTCRGCGRSPARGDNIKLHVDHIVAIALGGKTITENLQTLCEECNLGKSTKKWSDDPQLSLF